MSEAVKYSCVACGAVTTVRHKQDVIYCPACSRGGSRNDPAYFAEVATCSEKPTETQGRKFDSDKDRWDLLPWSATRAVVRVLTHGAKKYDDDNWRKVDDHRRRYFAAAQRHLTAWWGGESKDSETGESHLAHAICCLLFLMELENEPGDKA